MENYLTAEAFAADAIHAWSIVKVREDYSGDCWLLRRSSDGGELLIGFIGTGPEVVDKAAAVAFCGAGDGFLIKKFDQIGSVDLINTTSPEQPQVVSSGVALEAPDFDGSVPQSLSALVAIITVAPLTFTGWGKVDTDSSGNKTLFMTGDKDDNNDSWGLRFNQSTGPTLRRGLWIVRDSGVGPVIRTVNEYVVNTWAYLSGIDASSTSHRIVLDGDFGNSTENTDALTPTPADFDITAMGLSFFSGTTGAAMHGMIAEVVVFPSGKSESENDSLFAYGNPVDVVAGIAGDPLHSFPISHSVSWPVSQSLGNQFRPGDN